MGLPWGLPLSLVPVAFWVAAYRSTGESFPLEALLQRLAHRFTSGEHHAQPFYHVLISLPLEFFPWVILLPAALRQTFPRRGAQPDRDNAYVYSWIVVIFTVFTVSVEKRGVYLLPLLPLLALLVARVWDLALMDWDPSPVDRAIAWLPGICLALAIGGAVVAVPKIRSEAPDLLRPAVLVAALAGLTALAALVVHRRYRGGAALAVFSGGLVVVYLAVVVAVLAAIAEEMTKRLSSASKQAIEVLSRKNASRAERIQAIETLIDTHARAMLEGKREWSKLILLEQLQPTEAFAPINQVLTEQVIHPIVRLLTTLTSISVADAKLKTMSLLGRAVIFRIGWRSVLGLMGWDDLTPGRINKILDILRTEVRASIEA